MSESNGNRLRALLNANGVLVADGGMGTSLFAAGLGSGASPEAWNVERPEDIAAVHAGFVEAGADIILTNTFGGTASRLSLHKYEDRVAELNEAAVAVARGVADRAERPVLVAGSVGPTGELLLPLGTISGAEAIGIFAEQIDALVRAGCDAIWIETMSSLEELSAAAEAASGAGLPVVTTMSFDTHGSTMMGVSPAQLVQWRDDAPVAVTAIGANCGIGPGEAVLAVANMHAVDGDAVTVAKGNCGIPVFNGTELSYPSRPEEMRNYAELAIDAGARIVGACCGSIPEHIRVIREAVDTHQKGSMPTRDVIEARIGLAVRPEPRERRRSRASA